MSVVPFYRTMSFAAPFGMHLLQGATPKKSSDALDGVFDRIDTTGTISSGTTTLYKIQVNCVLFRYQDPDLGVTRSLIAILVGGKWFFASQGDSLTLIAGTYVSGVQQLYGTDGTSVYKLFSDTATAIATTLRSPLWDLGDPISMKQTLKAGVELNASVSNTTLQISMVSELGVTPGAISADNQGQWINSSGQMGQWFNSSLVLGNWWISGFVIYQGDVEAFGRYIGINISSTAPQYRLIGLLLEHEKRARWTGRG
jgi:hypothetical protein